jgi:hypothetical protein
VPFAVKVPKWTKRQMHEPLIFAGRSRPSVRVVGHKPIPGRQASGFGTKPLEALIIETSGAGRSYEVTRVEGWWRDFSEVRINNNRRVLSFLQQRGDPFGKLEPGRPIDTSEWSGLITVLRQAASAWASPVMISRKIEDVLGHEPPPEEGLSAFRPELREVAAGFVRALDDPRWTDDLGITYRDDLQPIVTAGSLASYMMAAAASSLRAGLPMRRCDYCASWFTLHYAPARCCSVSCGAAMANKRTSPHAFRAEEAINADEVGS